MNKNYVLALGALVLASVTSVAKADRPLVTELPQTVPVGEVQVESGASFTRGGAAKVGSYGELVASTGVTKNIELSVTQNYLNNRNVSTGLTDSAVRLKYQVNPNVGVVVGTSLPTGNRQYRSNYQPGFAIALSKDLTDKTSLLSNVGYIRSASGGGNNLFGSVGYAPLAPSNRSNTLFGSAAVLRGLNDKSAVFAELYGATDNRNRDTASFAVGAIREVSDNIRVDLRAGRSLRNVGQPNYFVGVGITLSR